MCVRVARQQQLWRRCPLRLQQERARVRAQLQQTRRTLSSSSRAKHSRTAWQKTRNGSASAMLSSVSRLLTRLRAVVMCGQLTANTQHLRRPSTSSRQTTRGRPCKKSGLRTCQTDYSRATVRPCCREPGAGWVLTRATVMQTRCMMGLLPEINRAWVSIDHRLFLWDWSNE